MSWHVLGFDVDAIVGAGQDWRLAQQCVAALAAATRPPTDGLMESAGDGEHLTFWYVRDDVGDLLDDAGVPWRRFAIGTIGTPPASASEHLRSGWNAPPTSYGARASRR